jgi:AcrR family transcriptional regulator
MMIGVGRRAGVSAVETRQELLDATLRVLLARGYGGARISEIAREAGVTPGSIYNHFTSKADLIIAAIAEQAPDAISNLLAQGDGASVMETFRALGSSIDRHAREMGPLLLELIVAARRDPEVAHVVAAEFAEKEAMTTDVIRLARDRGEVDPALDVEALARLSHLVALGSLVVGALDLKPVDPDSWAEVIDRVLDAVQPKGEKK